MALVVEYLDSLRLHKKRRRYMDIAPSPVDVLPAEWRDMLALWLRLGGNSRWETLLKKAGVDRKATAEALLNWLVEHGWAIVNEERKHGEWWPYHLELRAQARLRQALGLPDMDALAQQWHDQREQLQQSAATQPQLYDVMTALDAMPLSRVNARAALVLALLEWQNQARSGSFRDFALFARGDTKALSNSEWDWLNQCFELAEYGVSAHTPLLYLSADFCLNSAAGSLDLSQAVPFAALPHTLFGSLSTITADTALRTWICVENLTSFERLATQRTSDTAIVWIPGFPPAWWLNTMSHLLSLCPAPLQVACDPDPAGIRIAIKAISHWQAHHLDARPWRMGVAELKGCKHKKPLNDYDKTQLQSLMNDASALPESLAELVEYMMDTQQKAEQESYL